MNHTIAYYIIHYGREWLYWSMRSIYPMVDKIYLFYTPTPSHGHGTNLICPEPESRLRDIAGMFKNAEWRNVANVYQEYEHRGLAVNYITERHPDVENILVVDADEVWSPLTLHHALTYVDKMSGPNPVREYLVGMRHFWRSTGWVCDDEARPVRIIKPHNLPGKDYIPTDYGKVYHFGYAQTPDIIAYKQAIHGHKAEWRNRWFEDKFLPWTPGVGDVHPTCENFWNPVQIDENMPDLKYLIGDHPFYGKGIIA